MKLHIEKCVYGGAGLARSEGKTIFVPYTLPGELVEAHIVEDKRSFANAELDTVLEPASDRVPAPCSYFGKCGGCQYQHASYARQTELKLSILQETLERAHLKDLPEIQPVTAEPFHYRNRVRLHMQRNPFALCYKRRASHDNLAVDHCPIAAPLLEKAIQIISVSGTKLHLADFFTEVELFTNESQSELVLSFWTQHPGRNLTQAFPQICDALQHKLPAFTGAAVFFAGKGAPSQPLPQWGSPSLTYRVGEHAYRVSIGAFFQVNRFLVDRLVELVTTGRTGHTAWDLYAGAGLFSSVLATQFESLIAVEAAPISSRDLRENLAGPKHRSVRNGTLEFLQQQAQKPSGPMPEFVVVDPPRAGLGRDVTSLLTKVRPKTMVYVSCDPATLSRDLSALVESGYRLQTMHMVDLFPQTFHLESVTTLSLT